MHNRHFYDDARMNDPDEIEGVNVSRLLWQPSWVLIALIVLALLFAVGKPLSGY